MPGARGWWRGWPTAAVCAAAVCSVVLGAAPDAVSDAALEAASAGRTVRIGVGPSRRPTSIPLEVYVARVLAGEGEPRAADAAQQALAVAIRTFVTANRGRHHREGFDLCDTTHCQVPRTAHPASRRATLATAGQVLLHDGRPAELFYSASCGGRSEAASAVWPGVPDYPYLVTADDDVHAADQPWTADLSAEQVVAALRRAGFEGRRLRRITIEARNGSGRVARLALDGLQPAAASGAEFRMALGPMAIRSTAFTVEPTPAGFRFRGQGFGHGVGMCVIGAGRRAAAGESLTAILGRYYPGLQLGVPGESGTELPRPASGLPARLLASASAAASRETSAATAGITSAGATAPDDRPRGGAPGAPVRVTVAPAAGLEVAVVERLATEAFTTLARTLGTSVAPVIVRMHGSVDDFRRATGRPWWASSAVNGEAIDLQPASVLAQREGAGAVLRVAMAELLTAPALTRRAAWVRVGAARYFGRGPEADRPAPRAKIACPTDAELLAALSAPAQREAEVRAEACFVRAVSRSRDWRQVR